MTNDLQSKEILQPIVDLFTCADGGVAFTILRHDILPFAISDPQYGKQLAAFKVVSDICKNILKEYSNE